MKKINLLLLIVLSLIFFAGCGKSIVKEDQQLERNITNTYSKERNQPPTENSENDQSATAGNNLISNESVPKNSDEITVTKEVIVSSEVSAEEDIVPIQVAVATEEVAVPAEVVATQEVIVPAEVVVATEEVVVPDQVSVTVNEVANECQATLETEQRFMETNDTYISSKHEDRPWVKDLTEEVTVDDIAAEFNAARATDSTITTNLVMPSQTEWDSYSASQKTLYLLKSERCARGIRPFEGIDTNITISPAQYYANYLKDNDVWGHQEDGKTPWERLEEKATVVVNTNADFYNYAENLAYIAYGSSVDYPTIHEPVAMAVYGWLYDDKDDTQGSYGHRRFALSTGLVENFGEVNKEGLIGVGVSTIQYDDGGFHWTKVYTVLNAFDPNENWEDGINIINE